MWLTMSCPCGARSLLWRPLWERRLCRCVMSLDSRAGLSVLSENILMRTQMIAFGGGVTAGLVIPSKLGEFSPAATAWIAASYP